MVELDIAKGQDSSRMNISKETVSYAGGYISQFEIITKEYTTFAFSYLREWRNKIVLIMILWCPKKKNSKV